MNFVDAQEMHRLHPDTFNVPDDKELTFISKGDFVKVCCASERFWVIVTNVDKNTITGIVNNDLVGTEIHGLSYGDVIEFETRHVYDIIASNTIN